MKKFRIASYGLVASLALMVAVVSNSTACMFWFHQPQAPVGLDKFKNK